MAAVGAILDGYLQDFTSNVDPEPTIGAGRLNVDRCECSIVGPDRPLPHGATRSEATGDVPPFDRSEFFFDSRNPRVITHVDSIWFFATCSGGFILFFFRLVYNRKGPDRVPAVTCRGNFVDSRTTEPDSSTNILQTSMSDQIPASVGKTTEPAPEAAVAFDAAELEQIQKITERYPERQAAVMPALWMAQKKWGWLSLPVMQAVADALDLTLAHVQGVATFYTMYWKKPMGKKHVQVCTNISCMLRGGEQIYNHVKDRLGIGHMERTPDGEFSLEEVECMGACGGAPMIVVNEDYFENVSIDEVERLLSS